MGNQRRHIRIKGNSSECTLVDHLNSSHEALLEDISLGGALITMREGVPYSLQVGNVCSLMLRYNPNLFHTSHNCKVVRHDSVKVGVNFFTITIQ
jgi:c-di-GMP-binding flagellar brake protein YcgR